MVQQMENLNVVKIEDVLSEVNQSYYWGYIILLFETMSVLRIYEQCKSINSMRYEKLKAQR